MRKCFGVVTIFISILLFVSIFYNAFSVLVSYDVYEKDMQASIQMDNSKETKVTNYNQAVQTDSTGDIPSPIAVTSSTQYRDWSQLGELNEKYSYSTLFWSASSQVIRLTGSTNTQHYLEHDPNAEQKPKFRAYQGESFSFVITNCGVDADGDAFDVVITVNNVKSYRQGTYISPKSTDNVAKEDSGKSDYVQLLIRGTQYINSQQYPPQDEFDRSDTNFTSPGHIIHLSLRAAHASCSFTMDYYKKGTYSSTKAKANVTGINGFFYDLDVPHNYNYEEDESSIFLSGHEGLAPTIGSSTIYYDKNRKNFGTHNVQLSEMKNGIACTSIDYNTNGIWFKTSAYMTTELSAKRSL